MPEGEPKGEPTRLVVQLTEGTSVGHYVIVEKISAGGMGEVYLAEDTSLNRQVALKFLPHYLCQDADCRERFKREAQAAAKLNHPNIVTIHEVSEFNGRPFFAMEYVEGRPLSELIKQGDCSLDKVIGLSLQICEGLQEAHRTGVTHRDIKPANILISQSGRAKLVDFGLASVAGAGKLTKEGSILGTIGYMSPEQVQGKPMDHRSDLFSLGVVIYELISCKLPFQGETPAATMNAIVQQTPEPLARYKADVPDRLQEIINRALEKDPETRYQSAADMMAELRRQRRRSSDPAGTLSTTGRETARAHWKSPRFALLAITILLLSVMFWRVYRSVTKEATADQNHLAIVPFVNLADLSVSQAFCDGLIETLTSKLTQLAEFEGWLLVVPASEVRENGVKSAGQARRVFGVNFALTGSIQQYGDGIRTTLNLVDAATQRQLQGKVIDESIADVSALQDSAVVVVAQMLNIQLRPESRRVLDAGGTQSSAANEAYLEGRGYLQRQDKIESLDSARSRFEAAIRLDSGFALAYAGLGDVCWQKYSLTNDVSWVKPGMSYSSRALELNDQLAPVLVTIGTVHRQTGQYQEAIGYLKRALQIDSMNSDAAVQLAYSYESLTRSQDAETTFQGLIRHRPQNWRNHYSFARYYAFRGRAVDALQEIAKAESFAPPGVLPYQLIGSLYTFLGEYEKAKALLSRSLTYEPTDFAYSNLGAIYQMEEQFAKAAEMYEQALKLNDKNFQVWINLATVSKKLPKGEANAMAAYARAIVLAEQNREINPNDAALLSYLADCYWQTGQRDKSLSMAEQAARLAPDDVEVMVRVGIVYELAGRRDEALRLVTAAAQRGYSIDQMRSIEELRHLIADPRFDSILTFRR